MTSPVAATGQPEGGYTKIPNEMLEALVRLPLNGTQSTLVLFIIRKTHGYQKATDVIALAQFCAATGLPKKLVSRELGRLAKRQIITAWGDDYHPKRYGIERDYRRWRNVGGEDWAEVSTELAPSVPQSVDKLSTDRGITKEKKERSTETIVSGTLRDRFEVKYREATNKTAVLGELFSKTLGAEPDYPRLGRLAKELHSGGKLMNLMIEASRQRITDDPHDYLAAMVKRHKAEGPSGPRPAQADHNRANRGKVVI